MTAVPDAPYRIRPSGVRNAIAELRGTENGPVVYARPILAPETARAAVIAEQDDTIRAIRRWQQEQVRRKGPTHERWQITH